MLNLSKQERIRERYKQMKPGYQPALEIYRAIMDSLVTPETVLLDAGCGPGGLVKGYVGHARAVIGADAYASHFSEPAEIPTLVESELGALPFPDNHYTLITCSWVLEHLAQPERVFAEAFRVLRPGGHFMFITPNALNYAVWLRRLIPNRISKRVVSAIYARNEDFINPTYYRANSQRTIDRQMRATGFRCARFAHVGDPSYLAINEVMFRAAVLVEAVIDRVFPTSRVHLVGLYEKPPASDS